MDAPVGIHEHPQKVGASDQARRKGQHLAKYAQQSSTLGSSWLPAGFWDKFGAASLQKGSPFRDSIEAARCQTGYTRAQYGEFLLEFAQVLVRRQRIDEAQQLVDYVQEQLHEVPQWRILLAGAPIEYASRFYTSAATVMLNAEKEADRVGIDPSDVIHREHAWYRDRIHYLFKVAVRMYRIGDIKRLYTEALKDPDRSRRRTVWLGAHFGPFGLTIAEALYRR